MVTASKYNTKFHLRLFWLVVSVLLLICICFAAFQYLREKQYRIDLLHAKLTTQADMLHEEMKSGTPAEKLNLNDFIRISIIDFSGKVVYDSEAKDVQRMENHATRKEVKQAMDTGEGYEIHRRSALTGNVYFYAAKKYDNYIIRLATPYHDALISNFRVTMIYLSVTLLVLLTFIIIFYNVMRHLGANINRLNDFVTKAEREIVEGNVNDDVELFQIPFSNDEVGEISRHVVQIYYRLQQTQQALVTEQQRVLKQQEEQDRLKRQLTYNIAHELKTPVSSIQGYLETIINNDNITPDVLGKFIEKCYQQSTRLSSLLRDISTLSRIDEAPELITKERVDLSKLIIDILDDAALALKEKNIRVYNHTESLALVCEGNHSFLYSVFRNLVDNTVAYAGEGVSIFIMCNTENPQFYHFSYSDNGIGIPQEHFERIFERFYRIDKGRSRKLGGTGLGLSVVKNAIILHGGAITARQRQGGGLEFAFSIRR